jgi:hypothetical protein
MFTIDDVIEKLKLKCHDADIYHLFLSDLILKNSISLPPTCAETLDPTLQAINVFLSNEVVDRQDFKEVLLKALHQSWCQVFKSSPRQPKDNDYNLSNIPAILAWGYELRIKKIKKVSADVYLHEFDSKVLLAFWEAIKISGIQSILDLRFDKQSKENWAITCQGIMNCSLTSLEFARSYGHFSLEAWQLFWDAINSSTIQHLNLCSAYFMNSPIKDKIWEVLFNALSKGHLHSLSLERMLLSKLTTFQWDKLYEAIKLAKLSSLDLTCTFLNDSITQNNRTPPNSWKILCKIIRLPSLKKLRFLELDSKDISDLGWFFLCQAFNKSQLEILDFSVDCCYPGINDKRWILLLNALKKLPLKDLTLATHSAQSFSSVALTQLCDLLDKSSSLESIVLDTGVGSLVFSAEEWKLLGSALKKRGIKTFNFGEVELSPALNFEHFAEGLILSGVSSLCLGEIPAKRWIDLAELLKKGNIKGLKLIEALNSSQRTLKRWQSFCNFIVSSEIKEIAFKLPASDSLTLWQIELLSQAIHSSQLECFDFKFLQWNIKHVPLDTFKILCEAINNSNIRQLILPYHNTLPSDKENLLAETVKIVNSRSTFQKSLRDLCVLSLFNCNARLNEKELHFETEKNSYEIGLLDKEQELLSQLGFK